MIDEIRCDSGGIGGIGGGGVADFVAWSQVCLAEIGETACRFATAFCAFAGSLNRGDFFYSDRSWLGHFGAVLIFSSVLFGWVLFDKIVSVGFLEKRRKVEIPIILRQLGGVVVVTVALAAILKWGYQMELTGLVATSRIAAVIVGFAMQDLLANVIAGFSIHVARAYKVGDWLLLGEEGKRAEVREINWRSTRLIDNDQVWYELVRRDMRIPFPIRTLDFRTTNIPANFVSARENAARMLHEGEILSCLGEEETKAL
jgi:small-conductance mechanosensitive channel